MSREKVPGSHLRKESGNLHVPWLITEVYIFKRQAFAISPIKTHVTESARKLFCRYNCVGLTLASGKALTLAHCSLPSRPRDTVQRSKLRKLMGWRRKSNLINQEKTKNKWCKGNQRPRPTGRLMHSHCLSSKYSRKHRTPKQHFCYTSFIVEQDNIWYGTSLWPVWVSWSDCDHF